MIIEIIMGIIGMGTIIEMAMMVTVTEMLTMKVGSDDDDNWYDDKDGNDAGEDVVDGDGDGDDGLYFCGVCHRLFQPPPPISPHNLPPIPSMW